MVILKLTLPTLHKIVVCTVILKALQFYDITEHIFLAHNSVSVTLHILTDE